MSDFIDFYFDFISPYSYLAHCRLPAIAEQHGLEIAYHVVDLAAIKLDAGNTGPTTREMLLKLRYSGADQQRWAARYGVTLKRPSAYGLNRLNEGVFWASDRGEIGKQRAFGFHVAYRRDRHVDVQQKPDLAGAVRIFVLQEPGDVVVEFQEGVRRTPAHEVLVPLQLHQFLVIEITGVVGAGFHPK